jgi:hypothetical protein
MERLQPLGYVYWEDKGRALVLETSNARSPAETPVRC